uniref:Protocadherin 8 n=1 Tax=Echinococcus granulosus TaxID=6210 RepID=A0A068WF20_ECHGR|nr:protocadherin 8 [Echinococcus granulosus]
MLTKVGFHRFHLSFTLPFLLYHVFLIIPMAVPNNISQVYLFLQEEEIPVGKVVLSASRAIYLAKVYAKRGVYSVTIEESPDPSLEFYYPESLFNMSAKNNYFSINTHTGMIKTSRRLDFDDPELEADGCIPNKANSLIKVFQRNNLFSIKTASYCCFSLQIASVREDVLQLYICIGDVNDNAPKWDLKSFDRTDFGHEKSELTLKVPENLQLGNAIDLPPATDLDSGSNKAISYEMWPGLPEFEMAWNATTSKLYLVLNQELDREVEPTYKFSLIARDGGVEPNTASLSVTINVQDVNDNDPLFEKSVYFVTIPENTKISSQIIQVKAVDLDFGNNAEVTYSISTLTDPEFGQMFTVDPTTGWVKLAQELDFETHKQISLTITASDRGEPPRQSTCLVEITLTDVNDNAPKLIFEPGSLTNFALVPENEIAGRIVAVFTASDEDSEANGETECWIKFVSKNEADFVMKGAEDENEEEDEEGNGKMEVHNFFKLEPMALPFEKVYQLSTAAVFDREAGRKYRVFIMCSDKGSPIQSTTGSVLVRIQDVNDHSPEFPTSHFTIRAAENHQIGVPLFTLTAEDPDEGENATISYYLISAEDLFTLNNQTGEVSLRQPLDYEKQTHHNFTLLAVDGGQPALTGSVTVTLFIEDINDNAPVVTSDLLLSAWENHSAADPIGALSAIDLDSGLNGNFYFKIASIKPCFCGAPPTGEKVPDLNDSLCSWALEMVNKCDVNSVEKAHRLCSRAPLKYTPSWTSKEYRRFFMTERGDLYLRYPNLDRETVPVYLIQGMVTDRGHPPQRTTFCATVVVKDVNDCHPKFTFPALTNNTVLVRLPIHRGEPLVQLHATDNDANENGELHFAFAEEPESSVANLFDIHPFTGLMVSKYNLQLGDLEFLGPTLSILKQTHAVRIKVADLGTPSLASYANLRVRFQVRSNGNLEADFPSLKEQLFLQRWQQQHQTADPFEEYGALQADLTRSFNRTTWRSSVVFIILCAFFLILLLLLAVLLLAIFIRRSLHPLSPYSPTTTTASALTAAAASRRVPMTLFVSPMHHHQNPNYQLSGSSFTLPLPITPSHTLPHDLPQTSGLSGSGDLSIDSSAV